MNRHEKRLRSIKKAQKEHVDAYRTIWNQADGENREPSEEERLEVEGHLKAIEDLTVEQQEVEASLATLKRVEDIGRGLSDDEDEEPTKPRNPARPKAAKSLGDQFVESPGYKALADRGLTGAFTTGQIDLATKANELFEGDNWDASSGTPGSGAPLVGIDQQPGMVPVLYQPLTIADLLGSATTQSNSVRYVQETTQAGDNAAASVAEGGDKPQSRLRFDQADAPVVKIATFLPVSDEMLEDAGQIRGVINDRLGLFVRQEEEVELLNGTGAGADLVGILDQVPGANDGVFSDAQAAQAADHIYAGITVVRDSFLEADGIVVHPDDWADIRLLKDGNDNYIGGSPFSTTGSGEPSESLWSKRVVVTTAISAGTALVGAFRTAASVFRRSGLSVEASNSHSDYFLKNLTAIRAEERLALVVYRPESFAVVDLSGGTS